VFLHQKGQLLSSVIFYDMQLSAFMYSWPDTLGQYSSVHCKVWGSHSSIDEDSGVLGCKTVSLDELFPVFWRTVVPSSSGSFFLDWLPWIRRPCEILKHQKLLAQQQSITSRRRDLSILLVLMFQDRKWQFALSVFLYMSFCQFFHLIISVISCHLLSYSY
jgi:hypothetical protein